MQAKILQLEKGVDGQARVYVQFSDGSNPINPEWITINTPKLTAFKQQLQARAEQIKNNFAFAETLILGDFDITKTSLSQDEIEKEVWFTKYGEYKKLLQAAEKGFIKSDDTSITDLLTDLKQTYKSEYEVF